MKALVLSGGGALGAFEAGVIQALKDNGQEFDLVCGTSIGAINAALVSQDKIDGLTSLWHNIAALKPPVIDYVEQVQYAIMLLDELEKIRHLNLFGIVPAIERWMQVGSKRALLALRGAVKPDAIEAILADYIDFDALKRSLIVTATNLTYGSSEAFFAFVGSDCNQVQATFEGAFGNVAHPLSNTESFKAAVRASAAIPCFFEPVTMNLGTGDKDYVDGGVANNTPVQLAAMAGAREITVVLLQPNAVNATYATATLPEIALGSYTVMQQRLLELDMELASIKGVSIASIRPLKPLNVSLLGFSDQGALNLAFQEGYDSVK